MSVCNTAPKTQDVDELNCCQTMKRIEKLRKEMHILIQDKGRNAIEVLEKSRQLDRLLNYYYYFCLKGEDN
ncbi:MAG: aspartyl-phosphate phosphatase Spo0E family protein [Halanaerobiales bacterium]